MSEEFIAAIRKREVDVMEAERKINREEQKRKQQQQKKRNKTAENS